MKVRIWGARGSFPVPSKHMVRYGGNTPCLEVRSNTGDIVIIDCGSGLWKLGKHLLHNDGFNDGSKHASILLSHKHWDHTQGLPHFYPLYHNNQFDFYIRQANGKSIGQIFSKQFEKVYHPVPYDSFSHNITVHSVDAGSTFNIGNLKITVFRLNHPGVGNGFRIEEDDKIFVYSSDTSPFSGILMKNEFITRDELDYQKDQPEIQKTLKDLKERYLIALTNADFVIYDTHFTVPEYEQFPHFGHSTPTHAIEDCEQIGVKNLILFHHSPSRTDSEVDEILKENQQKTSIKIHAAYEGQEFHI